MTLLEPRLRALRNVVRRARLRAATVSVLVGLFWVGRRQETSAPHGVRSYRRRHVH